MEIEHRSDSDDAMPEEETNSSEQKQEKEDGEEGLAVADSDPKPTCHDSSNTR